MTKKGEGREWKGEELVDHAVVSVGRSGEATRKELPISQLFESYQ